MRKLLTYILLFLACPSFAVTTYYIDPSAGSDAANGTTTGTPWLYYPLDPKSTGTSASTKLVSGDTVVFKGGTSYTNTIVTTNGVTYDGTGATFGSGVAIMDGMYMITNGAMSNIGGIPAYGAGFIVNGKTNVTIKGFQVQHIGGIPLASYANFAWPSNYLPTVGGVGIYVSDATNIIVRDCTIQEMGYWTNNYPVNTDHTGQNGWGVWVSSGTGITITNDIFYRVPRCVGLLAGQPSSDLLISNVVITTCDFSHYINWMIQIGSLSSGTTYNGIMVTNNNFHDAWETTSDYWYGGPPQSSTSGGGNPHFDGLICGINVSVNNITWSNLVVCANSFWWDKTNGGGTAWIFLTCPSGYWQVFNNVFYNSHHGEGSFYVQDANFLSNNCTPFSFSLYNNTFTTPVVPIWVRWSSPGADEGNGRSGADPTINQCWISNNICSITNAGRYKVPIYLQNVSNTPAMDYDTFSVKQSFSQDDMMQWVKQNGNTTIGTFSYTLAFMRTNGWEVNGIESNPKFVNEIPTLDSDGGVGALSGSNLRLAASSPAIGAAHNLSSVFTTDRNGIVRPGGSTAWDAGAYEYAIATNLTLSISINPATLYQTPVYTVNWLTNGVVDIGVTGGGAPVNIVNFDLLGGNNSSSLASGAYSTGYFVTALGTPGNVYAYASFGGMTLTSNVIPLTFTLIPTTGSITTSANPVIVGGAGMLIYTLNTNGVVPTDANSGAMTIVADGNNTLFNSTPVNGVGTVATSSLSVGVHNITGAYAGNSKYAASSFSSTNLTVNASAAAATTTTITASPNPIIKPATTTVTSEVHKVSDGTLAANASGQTVITVNGNYWTSITVVNGIASAVLSSLPTVVSTLQAIYTGDANYAGSTSTNYTMYNFNGVVYAPSANVTTTNTYYIGTNATGLFVTSGYHGFANQPLDGSTYANFENNMSNMPINATIYALSGPIQTRGFDPITSIGWRLKSGQTLIGAGIDKTILQFPASLLTSKVLTNAQILRGVDNGSNITVRDLTLDCNYQTGVSNCYLRGMTYLGNHDSAINLKLTGAATFFPTYQECFGINFFRAGGVTELNYGLIQGCIITNFISNSNNNMSAFNMVAVSNAVIRDCVVYQAETNIVFGYNVSGTDVTISNCFGYGLGAFTYTDATEGGTNITYVNNWFTNCAQMIGFRSGTYAALSIHDNVGYISRPKKTDDGTTFIILPVGGITGLSVYNNNINSSGVTNGMFNVSNGTNITIQNNIFFSSTPTTLETNFTLCPPVLYIGNVNQTSQPWP